MACNSVAMPASQAATASTAHNLFKEHCNGVRRSDSCKDLRRRSTQQANIRRSYSDDHLLYCKSMNCNIRASSSVQPKLKSSRSFGFPLFQISGNASFIPDPVKSLLLFESEESSTTMTSVEDRDKEEVAAGISEVERSEEESSEMVSEDDDGKGVKRANWVERLLEIRSHWRRNIRQQEKDDHGMVMDSSSDHHDCDGFNGDDEDSGCMADYNSSEEEDDEEEETGYYNRETFSRLLMRVPWSDTKLFSKLAFLCNMAYVIPDIKANDLKRHYGLQFVTSSLEKKAEVAAMETKLGDEDSTCVLPAAVADSIAEHDQGEHQCCPEVAYEIAASAASYVQSRAKEIHPDQSSSYSDQPHPLYTKKSSPEVAAFVAASTMTAVVAAGEKDKQETANNLQSLQSSPCEWFICDDPSTYTRCFIIQGSDSFASWQANLFFEPAKFEGTDVLVHRGIYEAAKGIYDQFMPEIISHLETYGDRAKLQFTGHSLGGSLSLLIHLMLLTRKAVANPSILRPVVTFGSPFVFCGGKKVLNNLGLDETHICSVIMHRDIVPRAFSCNYPDHVALLLKRLNGTFRSHPCLNKQKMLYSPLGKLFILQPEEESSPAHPLMPSGSGFYTFDDSKFGNPDSKSRSSSKGGALKAFLNRPHPLETLSNPTAYGSEGTILRDHDSGNYLKALHGLVRQNTKATTRKAMKHMNSNVLWPLLKAPSPHSWEDQDQYSTGSNNLESSRLLVLNREIVTRV